ncbi:hypothetical protein SSX86_030769 [Deinandra increscens subsp. villosa]|uniref:Uncharacterized protein n=1 Tax=Deinandra increscens subsp. villosa TaxID=3103831 RepID=A0AAP0GIX2_9ASTR
MHIIRFILIPLMMEVCSISNEIVSKAPEPIAELPLGAIHIKDSVEVPARKKIKKRSVLPQVSTWTHSKLRRSGRAKKSSAPSNTFDTAIPIDDSEMDTPISNLNLTTRKIKGKKLPITLSEGIVIGNNVVQVDSSSIQQGQTSSRCLRKRKHVEVDQATDIADLDESVKKLSKPAKKSSKQIKAAQALKECKIGWRRQDLSSPFVGPLAILVLLYVDSFECEGIITDPSKNAISFWNKKNLKQRKVLEIKKGGFGKGRFKGLSPVVNDGSTEFTCVDVDFMFSEVKKNLGILSNKKILLFVNLIHNSPEHPQLKSLFDSYQYILNFRPPSFQQASPSVQPIKESAPDAPDGDQDDGNLADKSATDSMGKQSNDDQDVNNSPEVTDNDNANFDHMAKSSDENQEDAYDPSNEHEITRLGDDEHVHGVAEDQNKTVLLADLFPTSDVNPQPSNITATHLNVDLNSSLLFNGKLSVAPNKVISDIADNIIEQSPMEGSNISINHDEFPKVSTGPPPNADPAPNGPFTDDSSPNHPIQAIPISFAPSAEKLEETLNKLDSLRVNPIRNKTLSSVLKSP